MKNLGNIGVGEALMQSQIRLKKVLEKEWDVLVQSRLRFNRILKKILEKVLEALVESQVRINRVAKEVSEKILEENQVRFNRNLEKFLQKALGGFGGEIDKI